MTDLKTFGEMFKLYLGGYKGQKILSCTLDILFEKQNHTEEGKAKLKKLWPKLVQTAKELDALERVHAYQRCNEMVEAAMLVKPKLLDLIKPVNWSTGLYHQPIILGEQND